MTGQNTWMLSRLVYGESPSAAIENFKQYGKSEYTVVKVTKVAQKSDGSFYWTVVAEVRSISK